MGLIKAAFGAAGGIMAEQWKEYFYCEAIPADVLAVKGKKKVTGRSSNTKGDDNIITNGSVIAVADGQCMLIVEQGKVGMFALSRENILTICLQNPAYSPVIWGNPSRACSRISESVLPSAAKHQRISVSTILTPRRLPETSMEPQAPFPSGWWISGQVLTWILLSAVSVSTVSA